jgi:hypothetical protein
VDRVVGALASTPGRRNVDFMGFAMEYSRLYMLWTGNITLEMVSYV